MKSVKIDSCEFPDDFLYSSDGLLWADIRGEDVAVGVTSILSWISGAFRSVSFKPVGKRVPHGNVIGGVEGAKHFEVLRAPFECTIKSVNEELLARPRLLNDDPYGKGWFAIVRPDAAGIWPLLRGTDAVGSLRGNVRRLGVHCFARFPDLEMFEIGVECSAVLLRLDEALAKAPPGTTVHLVTDDPTSDVEMRRWSAESGNELVEKQAEGKLNHFIVKKP